MGDRSSELERSVQEEIKMREKKVAELKVRCKVTIDRQDLQNCECWAACIDNSHVSCSCGRISDFRYI